MFVEPSEEQGHLVVDRLFHPGLTHRLRELLAARRRPIGPDELVFWYAPGPRTKTRAENAFLAANGLHVNSMTLAPEVVLANELGIPTAALVVGHKPSDPDAETLDTDAVTRSLHDARKAIEELVHAFLDDPYEPEPTNHIYRFDP
jgi:5'-methylthioadenosine phosphorylase